MRLPDPMIEGRAQLAYPRVFLLGRERCQMQFFVNGEFTGVRRLGHRRDTGLGAFDQRFQEHSGIDR